MILVDLKGRTHKLNLSMYVPDLDMDVNKSSLHLRARRVIRATYPFDMALEEVSVPGEWLFLDFFLPSRKLVIEVHGQQHYHFSTLFHKTEADFLDAKKRDKRKKDWCEVNELTLVELPYDERDEQWASRIKNC